MSRLRRALRGVGRASHSREDAFREALLRLLERDLSGAEEALARAARANSDDPDAYLALAALYRSRGEIGRAIRIHQNLLLRSDLPEGARNEALAGLAADFQRGGFLQRAIAAFEEVLEQSPKDPTALRALGELHADARDFKRALEMSRRLAKQTGEDGAADEAALWVRSAAVAHAEGRSDDARRDLKRALRSDADATDAWIALGELEAERGKDKRALEAWKRVPGIDRRSGPQVYPKIEATYAALGKPRDYETWLRKLIDDRPGEAASRLALIRCLLARGAAEEALTEAQELTQRDPGSLAGQAASLQALLASGRDEDALKQAHELLQVLARAGLLESRERLM
ncbi:MAG: tetratricopeptide repeat protein [Deltaproteobacteria bacterium]|nr:tetratricopeptide repeat protein [Deltaproteobacteria bacterium]MBW2394244.1 tetratricopeptide repeat protein [Deltaproteobacteria bacterium]